MNVANKGIILAAGFGSRLAPITYEIPKPLISVNGVVMIETIIDAMIVNGIVDICIVVGHLREKFEYLLQKYCDVNIFFVYNPYYATCNNISSLYVARDFLEDAIITDGDLIIHNPDIFKREFDASGYCSSYALKTNEWLQTVNENDEVISCSRTGGKLGWQLYSVSFWNKDDGMRLKSHLEYLFEEVKAHDIYWDDVAMFEFPLEYTLKIRRISEDSLTEIDNLSELLAIDASYRDAILSKEVK